MHALDAANIITYSPTAFYISCQLAGVYFPKEKDLRDWGIQEDRKK